MGWLFGWVSGDGYDFEIHVNCFFLSVVFSLHWQIDTVDDETFGISVHSSLDTSSKTESFVRHIPPHVFSATAQLADVSEQDTFTMDWSLETSESDAGDPIKIAQEFSLSSSDDNEEVCWLFLVEKYLWW